VSDGVKNSAAPQRNDPNLRRIVGSLDENGYLDPDSLATIPFGASQLMCNITSSTCLGYGDETLIDERHALHTPKAKLLTYCNRSNQPGAACVGPVFGPSWTCRSCTCNFHNALCNRHAKTAPKIMLPFCEARDMLKFHAQNLAADYNISYGYWEKEWINKWPQNKIVAFETSLKYDVDSFGRVKSFVKREPGHKKVKKARAIQGYANFATQARLGPQVYAAQKTLCHRFNSRSGQNRYKNIGITFASGMNAVELGEWMEMVHDRFGSPWFYERDGANWDATMQAEHQELVNILYEKIFDPLTYERIQKCRKVKGVNVTTDRETKLTTKIKYTLDETTKSGHNDTSLRNSIINAAIAYQSAINHGLECEIIVAGDDLLMACKTKPDLQRLIQYESQLGINPEAGVMDDYTKVTFISGHWCKDVLGYKFVPLLGRLLLRLYWTTSPLRPCDYQGFKYGVSQGLKPSCGQLPVYSALLDIEKPKKITASAKRAIGDKYLKVWQQEQVFGRGTFDWFCSRYQTTMGEIKSLEKLIRDNQNIPCVLRHPLSDRIIARDLLEVTQRG
jgi:hypothetical protein